MPILCLSHRLQAMQCGSSLTLRSRCPYRRGIKSTSTYSRWSRCSLIFANRPVRPGVCGIGGSVVLPSLETTPLFATLGLVNPLVEEYHYIPLVLHIASNQ